MAKLRFFCGSLTNIAVHFSDKASNTGNVAKAREWCGRSETNFFSSCLLSLTLVLLSDFYVLLKLLEVVKLFTSSLGKTTEPRNCFSSSFHGCSSSVAPLLGFPFQMAEFNFFHFRQNSQRRGHVFIHTQEKLHTTFLLLKKHATTTPTHFMQKTSLGKENRKKLP